MAADPDTPYFLVAPVGWQTAMEVKRLFAEGDHTVPVVGAASVDAAITRLEDRPRCVAVLTHFAEQPQAAIELICRMKERWRRPVVAFHPTWHRDDVRRALQLGADCLLGWPFAPGEVLGDLQALQRDGVSMTRKALIERGGQALLDPDPALWSETGDDWRGRLSSLAERLRSPSSDTMQGRVTRLDPAEVLTRAAGGRLDPSLAAATMAGMRAGIAEVPRIAGEFGVEERRLSETVSAVLSADERQRAGIMALLDDLARTAATADEAGVMLQLRRAAQVALQASGAHTGGQVDLFASALSRATGVPVAALGGLSADDRVEIAGRVIGGDDDEHVLEQARLTLFAALLRALDERSPTPHDLAAMSALLGLRPGVTGIRPPEMVRMLARLDPPQALHDVELTRLAPLRDAVPEPGNALDQLLRRALDELIRAAAPMGLIDQTRLIGLLRSLKQGQSALVGPVTWRMIASLISGDLGDASRDERVVRLARRIERVIGASASDARVRIAKALVELAARQRSPMDLDRFVAFCREAATGVLGGGAPPGGLDGTFDVLEGLHRGVDPLAPATRSGPLTPKPHSGPMGAATGSGPLAVATRSGAMRREPGSPSTSGPMAALAGLADGGRAAGVGRGESHAAEIPAADEVDEGADAHGAARPLGSSAWLAQMADRVAVSPREVEAALVRGELERAETLADDLDDADPETPRLLNRIALEHFTAGRASAADPLWTRAAALAPSSPNILFHLGRLRFEQGRLGEARLLARQVLALRPHLTPARQLHQRIQQAEHPGR